MAECNQTDEKITEESIDQNMYKGSILKHLQFYEKKKENSIRIQKFIKKNNSCNINKSKHT